MGRLVVGEDEYASASLRHAIIRGIDDSPFDDVSKVRERSEHDGKITSTLPNGGFEKSVDVFEKQVFGLLFLLVHDSVDFPPKDALFSGESVRIFERFRDGIILTGESSNDHVVFGNGFYRDFRYVFVAVPFRPETRDVDVGSVLGLGRRLPLVAPYGFENIVRSPCEPDAESAHSGEQFDVSDFFLGGHVRDWKVYAFGSMVGIIFPDWKRSNEKVAKNLYA